MLPLLSRETAGSWIGEIECVEVNGVDPSELILVTYTPDPATPATKAAPVTAEVTIEDGVPATLSLKSTADPVASTRARNDLPEESAAATYERPELSTPRTGAKTPEMTPDMLTATCQRRPEPAGPPF